MKIVFLDIDGVLNTSAWIKTAIGDEKPSWGTDHRRDWWADMIDPDKVALLNSLLDATGACVVISSTWRILNPPSEMQALLEMRGFTGEVVGQTPQVGYSGSSRCTEIHRWLERNAAHVSDWVALDDLPLFHLEHFVFIPGKEGLQPEHIEEAMSHLNYGWSNVCSAIVACAANGLDEHFTKMASQGKNISSEEYELWDVAAEQSFQSLNQGSMGALGLVMDAIAGLPNLGEEE